MLEMGSFPFENIKKLLKRSYKAQSASTHSLYAATMQMYGGPHGNYKFQVSGIHSDHMKEVQSEWIDVMSVKVMHTLWFLAIKLNVPDVAAEIRESSA